ncbi:MAG: hypothetical protein NXI04_16975 [Planctomycetaceae bacterium]|nr:hypothetical protein [Planctomycetaceae bacterium]
MSFDYNKVSDLLVCPDTRAELVKEERALVSTDPQSRLCYPILDDIPRLLTDEATQLSTEDWAAVMQRHNRSTDTGQPN